MPERPEHRAGAHADHPADHSHPHDGAHVAHHPGLPARHGHDDHAPEHRAPGPADATASELTTSADPLGTAASQRVALLATLALLGITASWGSTFFLTKDLLNRVPTLDYLAVRFTIAGLLMLLVAPRAVARMSRETRRQAVVLGALYGVAQILQTAGLAHTAASVSGFVTGMYVVFTPLLAAVLLRTRINGLTWAAVMLATVGLGVLTLEGVSLGYGEAITLVAAGLYALHIVALGAWSRPEEAVGLAIVQLLVIAVICMLATAPNGIVLPSTGADWSSLVYMALVPGALALLGQTWAQAHLPPTRTAIIMSMEPVFATLFAVWLGGESATSRLFLGGGMVLAAMLVVELSPKRTVEGATTVPAT